MTHTPQLDIDDIIAILQTFPKIWDGKESILMMKKAGYAHWKQMEWIGFYFQFLCDNLLQSTMKIPGPKYGNVEFDGFKEIPWDFKAHPIVSFDGKPNIDVIVNDKKATLQAIDQYGFVGLILASGVASFDDTDRSFQQWHKELKGGLSKYEHMRIARNASSRLRKTGFIVTKIEIIMLTKEAVNGMRQFQEGFRNSDGSPRNAKVKLDTKIIEPISTIVL